jgi:glycosyltransferase involved in cell wall biosynthesis
VEAAREVVVVSGKDILEEVGGHGTYVRAMCRAALGAGFSPHVFCAGREAGVLDTPFGRVHRVASPLRLVTRHGPGEGLRTRFLPFHRRQIRSQIEEFLQDRSGAFIVHGLGPWGAIGVEVAARMTTPNRTIIPIVTIWSTVHDEHEGKRRGVSRHHGLGAWMRAQFEYRWMMTAVQPSDTRAITRSTRVLVNYESVARQVRQIAGHAPIEVVPYASEMAFDDPPAPRPRPDVFGGLEQPGVPVLVALSRHDSRKGIDILIEALRLLRSRGVGFRACVVGPGPLLDVHRRLARTLGITDTTTIVGHAEDPIAFLQHADVFVLPSIQEGSGSVSMLEAMQAGLAIVASDVDGIPEDVSHGDSAQLVPPGDPVALADALERVLADEGLRRQLQRRAREVFEARFSADTFSRSVGRLYLELTREALADG